MLRDGGKVKTLALADIRFAAAGLLRKNVREIAPCPPGPQGATVEVDGILVGGANEPCINAIDEVVLGWLCEQRPGPCAHVDGDRDGSLTVEDIAIENAIA